MCDRVNGQRMREAKSLGRAKWAKWPHERRGHNEGKNHKAAPSSGKGQPARLPKVAEMTINYFVESQRKENTQ